MVNVALALMFVVTGAAADSKPLEYKDALSKAQQEKKPLLVLVGARWCSSCEVMKRDTIAPMKEAGELDEVVVTLVDKDEQPELAQKLMKGQTLPQVVLFSNRTGVWKRFSLTGMQSKHRMAELLNRARPAKQTQLR